MIPTHVRLVIVKMSPDQVEAKRVPSLRTEPQITYNKRNNTTKQ